jgi:hypothetical protein
MASDFKKRTQKYLDFRTTRESIKGLFISFSSDEDSNRQRVKVL